MNDISLVFIFGNKTDLVSERSVSTAEAEEFALVHNYQYFETSALSGIGIQPAIYQIAKTILQKVEAEIKFFDSNSLLQETIHPRPIQFNKSQCCTLI